MTSDTNCIRQENLYKSNIHRLPLNNYKLKFELLTKSTKEGIQTPQNLVEYLYNYNKNKYLLEYLTPTIVTTYDKEEKQIKMNKQPPSLKDQPSHKEKFNWYSIFLPDEKKISLNHWRLLGIKICLKFWYYSLEMLNKERTLYIHKKMSQNNSIINLEPDVSLL